MKNPHSSMHYSSSARLAFIRKERPFGGRAVCSIPNLGPHPPSGPLTDVSSAFLALPFQTTSLSLQQYKPNLCHDAKPSGGPNRNRELRGKQCQMQPNRLLFLPPCAALFTHCALFSRISTPKTGSLPLFFRIKLAWASDCFISSERALRRRKPGTVPRPTA